MALNLLRQQRLRTPSPRFLLSPSERKAKTPYQREVLRELREKGIVHLKGLIDLETVESLRPGIERMVDYVKNHQPDKTRQFDARHRACCGEEEYGYYTTHDAIRFCEGLADVAQHEDVRAIANSYFGRRAMLARAVAFRYLPMDRPPIYQWIWHQDGWGRKINVMILLTEIGEGDQHLSYLLGSQNLFHSYAERNLQIPDDVIASDPRYTQYPLYRALGKPGDAFIFDTNGYHKAQSSTGRLRDIYNLIYYPDLTLMHAHELPERCAQQNGDANLFEGILKTNRIREERGTHNVRPVYGDGWYGSLDKVKRWLF